MHNDSFVQKIWMIQSESRQERARQSRSDCLTWLMNLYIIFRFEREWKQECPKLISNYWQL